MDRALSLEQRDRAEPVSPKGTSVPASHWPQGRPFGLFLSHDVDQIHDREFFRVLADVNHVRRRLLNAENGNVVLAARRIVRSLLRPKPATLDVETILKIEARHGFRSTWFLLHDKYWARQGARYSFEGPEIEVIARMIVDLSNVRQGEHSSELGNEPT